MNEKITMIKGDTFPVRLRIKDYDGRSPFDLTGLGVEFVVRDGPAPESTALFRKRSTVAGGDDTQVQILDPVSGVAVAYLNPADTNTAALGSYFYAVRVNGVSSMWTVAQGEFVLETAP